MNEEKMQANMICAFNKCGCCIPLRRGMIILAYIEMAIELCLATITYAMLCAGKEMEGDSQLEVIRAYEGLFASFFVVCITAALIAMLPIIGGHMKRPTLLRIYYWISLVRLVLAVALLIGIGVIMEAKYAYDTTCATYTIFFMYFLLVVRSTYLKCEKKRWQCSFQSRQRSFTNNASQPTIYTKV